MNVVLQSLYRLILGTWLGAWILFAFVVAPTAFRVLPGSEVAGQLVGPILDTLHLSGIGAGVALAVLAGLGRQGSLRLGLPLLLAVICAVSQFGITAAIDAVRPEAFGPNANAEAAASFAQLHEWSRNLYGLTGVGLIVLILLPERRSSS